MRKNNSLIGFSFFLFNNHSKPYNFLFFVIFFFLYFLEFIFLASNRCSYACDWFSGLQGSLAYDVFHTLSTTDTR